MVTSVTPQQQNAPLAIPMAIAIKTDDVSSGLGITSHAHHRVYREEASPGDEST